GAAGVGWGQPRSLTEELVGVGAGLVAPLVATAPLQLGHEELDDVLVRLGHDDPGEIEAVGVGLVDPAFELVGHAPGRPDDDWAGAAQSEEVGDLADGPGALAAVSERLDDALDGVSTNVFDL